MDSATQETNRGKVSNFRALIEEHFVHEMQLAESIEDLNRSTAEVFEGAGLRGPSTEQLEALHPKTEQVEKSSQELARRRQVLIDTINTRSTSKYESLKDFIRSLAPKEREELDAIRIRVLERTKKAQAHMVHNQAALFYTFDFHRKFLAGVLQNDPEQQGYRANGHSADFGTGNLVRKTC
jgi:hypothetical protein